MKSSFFRQAKPWLVVTLPLFFFTHPSSAEDVQQSLMERFQKGTVVKLTMTDDLADYGSLWSSVGEIRAIESGYQEDLKAVQALAAAQKKPMTSRQQEMIDDFKTRADFFTKLDKTMTDMANGFAAKHALPEAQIASYKDIELKIGDNYGQREYMREQLNFLGDQSSAATPLKQEIGKFALQALDLKDVADKILSNSRQIVSEVAQTRILEKAMSAIAPPLRQIPTSEVSTNLAQ